MANLAKYLPNDQADIYSQQRRHLLVPSENMNAIVIVILAAAAAAVAAPVDDLELQFVTFVHRHGDRSPVGTYPTDPYKNESMWNNGWGELTTAGKQRAYHLGKWLRMRYANFLPKIYNKNDIKVQSTDVSRALMSAYSVLAGLYEPEGSDVWHPEIKWQPIPVYSVPKHMDKVLAASKPCAKHTQLLLDLILSDDITAQLNPVIDSLSQIVQHAGYNSSNSLSNFIKAVMVYDSLKVQNQNKLELPKWTQPYFPEPLESLSSLMLRASTYNKPLQRLSCGPLVEDILDHFKSKARGILKQKMWQYSAHDITIVGLRQCLGFNDTDSPPYASALILELVSKDGDHHVRVLYKAEETLKTMVIPGCSEFCPLAKFERLMSPIIPADWEAECKL